MRITKYFSKSVRSHIENGSFRFGSLSSYNKTESTLGSEGARFGDESEGRLQIGIEQMRLQGSAEVSMPGLISLPGAPGAIASLDRSVVEHTVRAYVFCSTIGDYNPKHHEKMLNGTYLAGLPAYPPNPDLTDYVVIDADRFGEAIDMLHPHNRLPFAKTQQVAFDCAPVKYEEKDFVVSFSGRNFSLPTEVANWRAVFLKPPRFSVEREFRHVLRNFESDCITYSADAAIIASPTLSDAIEATGSI